MSDNSTPHAAQIYDKNVRETLPYYDLLLNETIDVIKTIKPQAKNWIDTGCGTGNLIEKALKEFKETEFFLADPSQEMLDIALTKYSDNTKVHGLGNLPTQDLLSAKEVAPEVITAIQCHHYLDWETRKKAILVCFQLLQKGGLFVTTENISPSSEEGIAYAKERSVQFQITQGRSEEDARKHTNRFGINYFPITVSSYVKLLEECGFQSIEVFWTSHTLAGFYCSK